MTRAEYFERQKLKYLDPQKFRSVAYSQIDFGKLADVFENHLTYLEKIIVQYYTKYIFEEDGLIRKFVEFKEHALKGKFSRFKEVIRDLL
jgi:hypothetical protein